MEKTSIWVYKKIAKRYGYHFYRSKCRTYYYFVDFKGFKKEWVDLPSIYQVNMTMTEEEFEQYIIENINY